MKYWHQLGPADARVMGHSQIKLISCAMKKEFHFRISIIESLARARTYVDENVADYLLHKLLLRKGKAVYYFPIIAMNVTDC